MLNVNKLVYKGTVLGLRVHMANTSNELCVDTTIENLGVIKKLFKEDEITWLKDYQLYLQDGKYKTSMFSEIYAIEVEDENLLNLILGVERTAGKMLKSHQKKYTSWFYIELSGHTSSLFKEDINFIKKWYYIRYLLKSESFYIHLYEDMHTSLRAFVNYTRTPNVKETERILLSTLEKFKSEVNPYYILFQDTHETTGWSIYDLNSYIHGGEPLYRKNNNQYMYLKYIDHVYLTRIDLHECFDGFGNEGAYNVYDYALVDVDKSDDENQYE